MDLTQILGPVAALVTAAGALPLANFAQRGPENRLRAAISSNMRTIDELGKLELANKESLQARLEGILDKQLANLALLEDRRMTEKLRNWPSLAAAVVLAVLITVPMWFMWKPVSAFAWIGFIFLGIFAILILMSGLLACFGKEQNEKRLEKSKVIGI
jgi:hypothetical protein